MSKTYPQQRYQAALVLPALPVLLALLVVGVVTPVAVVASFLLLSLLQIVVVEALVAVGQGEVHLGAQPLTSLSL